MRSPNPAPIDIQKHFLHVRNIYASLSMIAKICFPLRISYTDAIDERAGRRKKTLLQTHSIEL